MRFLMRWMVTGVLLCGNGVASFAAENDGATPAYLELARHLVATIKPENTSYVLGRLVEWDGGLFSSEPIANTDCSGFVSSVLQRSSDGTYTAIRLHRTLAHKVTYPQAVDYYESIVNQWGFKNIDRVSDIRPGDIVAFVYPPGTHTDTGHVMIADQAPVEHEPTSPIVEGTRQWALVILDSAKSPHWKGDTRYRDGAAEKQTGIGRGTLRLYTDAAGKIVGHSWSPGPASAYIPVETDALAVGRPAPGGE